MQINLVPTAASGQPNGSARVLLLPDVLELLQPGPLLKAQSGKNGEPERNERTRRKDPDYQNQVAGAATTLRPSEVILKDERDMAPGSRAARADQLRTQVRDQAQQDRQDFRQALSEAAAREKPANNPAPNAKTNTTANPTGNQPGSPGPETNAVRASEGLKTPSTAATARATVEATGTPAQPAAARFSLTPAVSGGSGAAAAAASTKAGVSTARMAAVSAVAARGGATATVSAAAARPVERGSPVVAVADATRASAARKSAAPAASSTPASEPSNTDANVERILRLIRARGDKDHSVATLRLDPPELGKMRVRIELRDERVALQIDTDNDAARRLLSEQVDALRRSLEASGLQLERVEVRSPETTPGQSPPDTSTQQGLWHGPQDGGAHQEAESAGRATPAIPELGSTEPTESAAEAARVEPAAESLVNVWA